MFSLKLLLPLFPLISGTLSTAALPVAQSLPPSKLVVLVQGLEPEGQICISLFASSQGFPNQRSQAAQTRCVDVTETPFSLVFEDLRPGSYGVAAFQDTNGDQTFNRNGLGMPLERFGFSQNPPIAASAPPFRDTLIVVAGQETTIEIQMRSLFGD